MRINGYRDLVEIGRGAFSTVYRGSSERFSRDVAVKVFAGTMADPKLAEAFDRECRLIGGLSSHPHVVTVHDSGLTEDQRPYIVMQYYACGSLADVVARDGVLTPGEVVTVAQAAGAALDVAHEAGVVHRDIKPHNLMLDQYGVVALGDFGIARPDDAPTTTLALTPAFAAPEVLTTGAAGPRSDLYSLAATLHWLLTGTAPHLVRPGEPELVYLNRLASAPADRLPDSVPAPLAEAIAFGLARDPAGRPGSVATFVAMIRNAATAARIDVPAALTGHERAADTVRTPASTSSPAGPPPSPPAGGGPAPSAGGPAPSAGGPAPSAGGPARPAPEVPPAPVPHPTLRSRPRSVVVGAAALTVLVTAGALWVGMRLSGRDRLVRTVSATSAPATGATGPATVTVTPTAGTDAEWLAPALAGAPGGAAATTSGRTPPGSSATSVTTVGSVGAVGSSRPAAEPTTRVAVPPPATTTAAAPAPPPPTVHEAIAQDGKTKPSFSNYQNFADRQDNIPGSEWIAVSCQAIMSSAPPAGASYTSHWYRIADSRWAGRWIQTNSYHTRTRQGSTVTHTYDGDNSAEDWDHTIPLC